MDCIICLESPCLCAAVKPKAATARAPRRSPSVATIQQPKRQAQRFSLTSDLTVTPKTVTVEPVREESVAFERSDEELVRILAPLLAASELKAYADYLPADCGLTLDERRRKFLAEVKWPGGHSGQHQS